MSNFPYCYSFMMGNEDSQHLYKTVPDAPLGAFAISGINSAAFPKQFSAINAIPQAQRGPAVQEFYEMNFWNHWLDQLLVVDLAARVFDASVNMGSGTAVKLLQESVNLILPNSLTVDGHWGANTISHANCIPANNPANIVDAFRHVRGQYYKNIVANNPDDEKYLADWLARAQK